MNNFTYRREPARMQVMPDREQLIRDVPLLARLSEDDLRALASRGRSRAYRPGTVIFQEGDPGDSLHVVVEGAVRIVLGSPSGEEATIATLGPGEFVGHLALLDGKPRSASAVASGRTRTLVVRRDDFRGWLAERPGAALALLEGMSLLLRQTDETLTDLTFLGLPQRLAKRLLDLAAAHQQSRSPGEPVRLRITQAGLASMLGVSRESVNKQLNAFAKDGMVKLGRGTIAVLAPEVLGALAADASAGGNV